MKPPTASSHAMNKTNTGAGRDLNLFGKPNRPLVMGIVNATPDSFFDGGRYYDSKKATARGLQLADEGADILDIGGESTRPGSEAVGAQEQIDRVCPVIERLRRGTDRLISVDTRSSKVAAEALSLGADIINDVSALRFDTEMLDTIVEHQAGLVLMHMKGTPEDMQAEPFYEDIVEEVALFLAERMAVAEQGGVRQSNIVLDPGIGFGKTVDGNLELLKNLDRFNRLGKPVLIGASRKSFIGRITGAVAADRLSGSLAVACYLALKGVDILRVHDVSETMQLLEIISALGAQ